jgi:Flp pilus assembly protein TadD
MPEKRVDPWTLWEQCEGRQGAEALSRLAGELPEFFADSMLVSSRWSRLSFYATHRLMELQFVRDRGVERAFVLHGPRRTWWLNGESNPMHEVNEAESLALTQSTVSDYIRFFFYFLRSDAGAFVLIESAGEVGPQADADGQNDHQDEMLALEAARNRARPLLMRGFDATGRWLVDATVAYDGSLFGTSLAVDSGGNVEMTDDEPIVELDRLAVPEAPSLKSGEITGSPELAEMTGESPADMVLAVPRGQHAGLPADTAEVFVGRATEQDKFRYVLSLAGGAAGGADTGHVVLVHGLGGIGKSTLLRRLHETAGQSRRGGPLVAEIVDCEEWRNRGDYAGPDGPPVWKLLDRLYRAVRAGAADRPPESKVERAFNRQLESRVDRAFAGFRQAMAALPELERRASELGIEASFGRGRLSAEELSALFQAVVGAAQVATAVTGVGAPVAAASTVLAGPLGTATRAALDARKVRRDGRVDVETYNTLLAGLDRLVDQFAHALREMSLHAGPVVMFIDTGELLGKGLEWLRYVAQRSGSRVVWVLGLRLEAESDARLDSSAALFRRDIPQDRLWSMPLTRFDNRMVEEYLRSRLGDEYPAGLDIGAVARLTHGIPLAVYLVSPLLGSGQDLTSVLAPVQDGEVNGVVLDLARHYLVHVSNTPALRPDLPLLHGLALLYSEDNRSGFPGDPSGRVRLDPDVLAALWDVPAQTVAACLDSLAARHDFVLSRSRRLHQEVRESILLLLLDPSEYRTVREMNTRVAALYRERAAALGYLTVDAQMADQSWRSAMIALLWHTFWIDLDKGLQMLKGLFAAAVVTDGDFAAALLRAAAFFAPVCTPDSRRLISNLQVVSDLQRVFRPSRARQERAAGSVRDVIQALRTCPAEPLLATAPPAAGYYNLLRASCHEALGLKAPDRAALLLRAASDVEPGGATARVITSQARELAANATESRSTPADTQQTIVSALSLLTRFDPDDATYHDNLGDALLYLERYDEAEAAYRDAVHLDPVNAIYHNDLGIALSWLGRYDEVETACREAVRLDPGDAIYRNNLGGALSWLSRFDEAEAAYREALRLDPSDADFYEGLGYALAGLGRYDEAEATYREAVRLNPGSADPYNGLGFTLASLGRYDEAEAAYREAVRLNPSFVNPRNGLGRLYLKLLGRVDEAAAALRAALRLDPRNVSAHANLGSVYIVTGQLDAARSSFLQATQSAPAKHAFSELMLGALDRGTNPSAAEGHFTAALTALDQPYQPAFLTPFERAEIRALAMAALDRGQEATAVFERAVSKRSGADVFQRQHYEVFGRSGQVTGIDALTGIWRGIIASDNSAAGPWGEPRTSS